MDGPRLPGGEGGIRTHDRVAPTPVFKTGAFNRSATSPQSIQWRGLILSGHGHRSGARTGRSGDATAPLALLVGDPDSGIFQFARFVIELHMEHDDERRCQPPGSLRIAAVTRLRPDSLLRYRAASAILSTCSATRCSPLATWSMPHRPKLAVTWMLFLPALKGVCEIVARNLRATSSPGS